MKNKTTRFLTIFFNSIFIFSFLAVIGLGTFFIVNIADEKVHIDEKKLVYQTKILDKYNNEVESLGAIDNYVQYEEIPQVLIDALLSIEDSEFYYHNGFNPKRIILSLINNISSSSMQGGSTITQQLIKNTALTNEKTYSRKVKEAYLSVLLEQDYSKEEILELYFNKVYFEQSIPGVGYASKAFFNKEVSQINLIEASILASLVKSPSYYYPFSYPSRTNERKNLVLKQMLKNNSISIDQYNLATSIDVEDILYKKDNQNTNNYPFQAYLDLVYEEVKQITGKDLYTHPLIVETYLDSSLQSYIDKIQSGENIFFTDDEQQIGGAVIENDGFKIIGMIGGRNYNGKKIFNRGYHLKRSPASSIKPLLSYVLGCEHLSLHPLSTIKDEPYTYQGTNINVNNADKKYLGNISLIEALGYSRNTCAVKVFDEVVNKIGINEVKEYLEKLNLYDGGIISSSYSIGGMTYGLSPLQMAGGYSYLANHGKYLKPSTIKRISSYNGKVIYERDLASEQIISRESADQITYSLNKVINRNYLGINIAKPKNAEIAGKTGTNAYDYQTIKTYGFPSNADKDIWFCGYSIKHSIAIWTGFDLPEYHKNYFTSHDSRKKVAKLIFKNIMEQISSKSSFSYSPSLKEIALVKGLDDNYLPNEFIPSSFIDYTLADPNKIKLSPLPEISIEPVDEVDVFYTPLSVIFQIKTPIIEDEIYSKIWGEKVYYLKVLKPNNDKEEFTSADGFFCYDYQEKGEYSFEITIGFTNNNSLFGDSYHFDFNANFL